MNLIKLKKMLGLIFLLTSCNSNDVLKTNNELKDGLIFSHRKDGTLERVDKYEEDSLVSSAMFDSTGTFLKSTYRPEFKPRKNTLHFGEEYTFDVGFNSEPLGKVKVIIGYYDNKKETIGDTLIYMILPEKRMETLSLIPKYRGENTITGQIEDYFIYEGDSGKIGYTNFFEFETSFFVEPNE